jgi:hypothetical protein
MFKQFFLLRKGEDFGMEHTKPAVLLYLPYKSYVVNVLLREWFIIQQQYSVSWVSVLDSCTDGDENSES